MKIIDWDHFIKIYAKSRKEVSSLIPNTASSHNRYLYIQKTLENFNMRFNPNLIYEASNIYWDFVIKNMTLFPGVKYVLEKIKENHIPISIVTDLTADIQNQKLLKLKIEKYIDYLITSEEAGVDKPNSKIMDLTLKKMKLNANEVVFVGNNPKTDVQVAHNVGSKSILFDYNQTYTDKKEQNSATFYINNFLDVLKVLDIKTKKYSSKKLLIFDVMGTLTEKSNIDSSILPKLLPQKSTKLIRKYYKSYKIDKISNAKFWEKLGFKNKFFEIENKFLEKIILRKEVPELMEEFKKNYELAILSNMPKEWGQYLTGKYEFKKYFKEIVFSGDYGVEKPNPEIYKLLLDKFPEIKPSNVYFIDDELEDLSGGKKMLMQTVWLKSQKKTDNYIPDYVIDKLEELKDILK